MKTNTLPNFLLAANEINIIGPCSTTISAIDLELPSIVVDGGMNHHLQLKNSFSVGDGDSTDGPLDLKLPTQKDQSDLSYALSLLTSETKIINLYGFLGNRKDHELINIGEVYSACEKYAFTAKFDSEFLIIPEGFHTLNISGEFSVMTLRESLITIVGRARYMLEKETLLGPLSSHGLSNYADGEITITCNTPLIIYTQEQSPTLS